MADQSDTAQADYEVTVAREIGGVFREAGDPVSMMRRQAKYYLPPHGTGLQPVAAGEADDDLSVTFPEADVT
jgi:hypothetical protein